MQENINKVNTKEKPLFPADGKWNPQTLKELALKAVDDKVLIQRLNRKLTLDYSSLEHDTSGDSNITQFLPCGFSSRKSIFHSLLHMENIVITLSDEAKRWIDASAEHVVKAHGGFMSTSVNSFEQSNSSDTPTTSDILSDDSDIMDEEDVSAVAHNESSELTLCQNRMGYSKHFIMQNNDMYDMRVKLNLDLELLGSSKVEQEEFDKVRCTVVRTCEETIEHIQADSWQRCGKRKLVRTEDDERPQKQLKLKPKCGCLIS